MRGARKRCEDGRVVEWMRAVVAIALLSVCMPPSLCGQSLLERKVAGASGAVEIVLSDDAPEGAGKMAIAALGEMLDALGNGAECDAARLVLATIKASDGGTVIIKNDVAAQLLDAVTKNRNRGNPDRLLPALLLLQSRDPSDPRVQFALGEALAVRSAVFDPARADKLFGTLLDGLRDSDDAVGDPAVRRELLAAFLPEMSVTAMLDQRARSEQSVWLRRHLLGFRDTLQKSEPIQSGLLADERLIALHELLAKARRKCDQAMCLKLVTSMVRLQPNHPVLLYALAEVHASMGPAFDAKRAVQLFDEFLLRTDPEVIGSIDGEAMGALPLQEMQRDLIRHQLAQSPGGVPQLREAGEQLRKELAKAKPEPTLLSPNRKQIDLYRRKILSRTRSKRAHRSKVVKKLARNERNLLIVRKARVSAAAKGQRIAEFKQEIRKQKATMAKLDKELGLVDEQLKRINALLKPK
ncbi:MAG: hypothetical protein ACI89X_004235 [Planctomycetota bacterium]|jgi:hypothetical protein